MSMRRGKVIPRSNNSLYLILYKVIPGSILMRACKDIIEKYVNNRIDL
jgi:hypothetical protein